MFDIIYSDPPWNFKTYSDKGKDRSPKYLLMDIEDIKKIPVPDISEKNSVLFLWTTKTFINQAFEVIKAWDFKYKTIAFTWVKQNKISDSLFMGTGYYTRGNAEFCLLGTRGKGLKVYARNEIDVIISHIRNHSQKPEEAYQKIESLFPKKIYKNRAELFATNNSKLESLIYGYLPIGYDIDNMDITERIKQLNERPERSFPKI